MESTEGRWTIEQSQNRESLITNVVRSDTFPKIVLKNCSDRRCYTETNYGKVL